MSRHLDSEYGDGSGWFVGMIVALALLAIGYLVFSANDKAEAVAKAVRDPASKPFMEQCLIRNPTRDIACYEAWKLVGAEPLRETK